MQIQDLADLKRYLIARLEILGLYQESREVAGQPDSSELSELKGGVSELRRVIGLIEEFQGGICSPVSGSVEVGFVEDYPSIDKL